MKMRRKPVCRYALSHVIARGRRRDQRGRGALVVVRVKSGACQGIHGSASLLSKYFVVAWRPRFKDCIGVWLNPLPPTMFNVCGSPPDAAKGASLLVAMRTLPGPNSLPGLTLTGVPFMLRPAAVVIERS